MPRFEPFAGLRYDTSQVDLDDVVAPPYDVLGAAERARARRPPSRTTSCASTCRREPTAPGRYERAALDAPAVAGRGHAACATSDPPFTLYRMAFTDEAGRARTTVGSSARSRRARGRRAGDGGVLPHERTTPKASTDRLELTRATGANLSPIWGLSLAPGLTELLTEPGAPLGSTGRRRRRAHTVERSTIPSVCAAIGAAVGGTPVLIADGHHRYGVARTYRESAGRRAGTARRRYDLTWPTSASWSRTSSAWQPIHRLLDGLPAGRDWLERS